jgi:hypothetical protein
VIERLEAEPVAAEVVEEEPDETESTAGPLALAIDVDDSEPREGDNTAAETPAA